MEVIRQKPARCEFFKLVEHRRYYSYCGTKYYINTRPHNFSTRRCVSAQIFLLLCIFYSCPAFSHILKIRNDKVPDYINNVEIKTPPIILSFGTAGPTFFPSNLLFTYCKFCDVSSIFSICVRVVYLSLPNVLKMYLMFLKTSSFAPPAMPPPRLCRASLVRYPRFDKGRYGRLQFAVLVNA